MAQKATAEDKQVVKNQSSQSQPDVEKNVNQQRTTSASQLQRTAGNAAVQRMMAPDASVQRKSSQSADIDEQVSKTIQRQRGGGEPIHDGMAAKAEQAMGGDFSNVRVHTDSTADKLSRKLGAQAFTTGNDIFFRSGKYNPNSKDGQNLITHELTHVKQQGGKAPAANAQLRVNDPNDGHEAEANSVADRVSADSTSVQRSKADEEQVQMKSTSAAPEEEIAKKPAQDEDVVAKKAMPEDEVAKKPMDEEDVAKKAADPAEEKDQPAA